MSDNHFGNRITDNALGADDGKLVIQSALKEIEQVLDWRPVEGAPLFSGVYYDSKKVGSFIVKVVNLKGDTAVLKLQLKPLPYDEGMIIRHLADRIKSSHIRLPMIYADAPWSAERGYGYTVFEDLSSLPDLWTHEVTDEADRERHRIFLQQFFSTVLPMEAWVPKPSGNLREKAKKNFEHFREIALKSSYSHVLKVEVDQMASLYFFQLEKSEEEDVHFTHGHLSGKDVKFNPKDGSYVLLANLYWSWRPAYYELIFPLWVDVMQLRDKKLSLEDVLERVDQWCEVFRSDLLDHDPATRTSFWLRLLERAMLTVMLDLGASEWKEEEREEKQALLDAWKGFFFWILENKLTEKEL